MQMVFRRQTQVSNEMLSLVTSQTRFTDVSERSDNGDADSEMCDSVRLALRELKGRALSKFKERHMYPLVRDMWFYSENITTGNVQLQCRGKGILSRRH